MENNEKQTTREELNDDMLQAIFGGNDDVKEKGAPQFPCTLTCGFCNQKVYLKSMKDMSKHMVHDCPNNPYK